MIVLIHNKLPSQISRYANPPKQIVEHYVNSYNSFDVAGMLKNLDQEIIFENMSNGVVDLRTDGIEDFRIQAETATQYFKERTQKIVSWTYSDTTVTIMIDYKAILNMDLPNGMKKGDTLEMKGQSQFEFKNDRIVKILDVS